MALDKVVDSAALDAGMTAVADAIRAKAGTKNTLVWPDGFKAAINGIPGGGASGIYMAQVTPETDLDSIKITHNLGTTDILMAACFAETLGDSVPSFNGILSKFWAKTDIPVRISSSENGQNFDAHFFIQHRIKTRKAEPLIIEAIDAQSMTRIHFLLQRQVRHINTSPE